VSADMVTIYRVENERGCGPYRDPLLSTKQEMLLSNMWERHIRATHPDPEHDNLTDRSVREMCAFTSIEALRAWFKGFGSILSECEFVVNVYKVPSCSVRRGGYQCLVLAREIMSETATHTFSASAVIA
jgi:hypothetical protein